MNKEEIPIEYYLTKNGEVIKFVRYDELDKYKKILDKIKEYINQHCVNQKVSKEVGYKCYTMADTQELEHIMKLLEEIE